jgi:hypothetical protein
LNKDRHDDAYDFKESSAADGGGGVILTGSNEGGALSAISRPRILQQMEAAAMESAAMAAAVIEAPISRAQMSMTMIPDFKQIGKRRRMLMVGKKAPDFRSTKDLKE